MASNFLQLNTDKTEDVITGQSSSKNQIDVALIVLEADEGVAYPEQEASRTEPAVQGPRMVLVLVLEDRESLAAQCGVSGG